MATPQDMQDLLKHTVDRFLPLWMKNVRENFQSIIAGKDFTDIKRDPGGSAIIVGGGPSVYKYGHLEALASSGYKGAVISTDRMLIPLLNHMIVPRYVCSVDAQPPVEDFFKSPLVEEHATKIKAVFAVNSPKSAVDRWVNAGGEVYWLVSTMDPSKVERVTEAIRLLTGKAQVDTLGQVTGCAYVLARYLGKEPLCLIGFDLSYDCDKIEDTPIYKNALSQGVPRDVILKTHKFRRFYNPVWKKWGITEITMETYCHVFKNVVKALEPKIRNINCSEQGLLWEGVENMKFKSFLEKFKE